MEPEQRLKRIAELMDIDPRVGSPEGDELLRLTDEQATYEDATLEQPLGKLSGEPPGTILFGSINKRAYLFVCQTSERMKIERANARQHGIEDPIDFIFEFDGYRHELSYDQLKQRLCSALTTVPEQS